ncbi:MAG TPA: hypothetical protein VFX49_11475 [Chloroflexota bacterium]|nr:hypothetical protein [Chloroflexota bacterium]
MTPPGRPEPPEPGWSERAGLPDLADEQIPVVLAGRQIAALWRVLSPTSAAAVCSPDELRVLGEAAATLIVAFGRRAAELAAQRAAQRGVEEEPATKDAPRRAQRPAQGPSAMDVVRLERLRDRRNVERLLRTVEAALGPAEDYEASARLPEARGRPAEPPLASASSLRRLAAQLRAVLTEIAVEGVVDEDDEEGT